MEVGSVWTPSAPLRFYEPSNTKKDEAAYCALHRNLLAAQLHVHKHLAAVAPAKHMHDVTLFLRVTCARVHARRHVLPNKLTCHNKLLPTNKHSTNHKTALRFG